MRVGVVILPELSWTVAVSRWRDAEARGFSTGWTYDHLSWRSLRDSPWFGAVPLLAAVATATRTLRIGTLVTSPNFRHPVLLAKDVMTLDDISAGRIDLGIGAGGVGFDAVALGGPASSLAERGDRFAEFVDALDVLLSHAKASFRGKFFTAVESRTIPGCVQRPRPPFTIAAAGRRALDVAARHGAAWVTFGPLANAEASDGWFAGVAGQSAALDEACARIGRDPGSIDRIALVPLELDWPQSSVGAWDDFCGRLGELRFTDVVLHWPRPDDRALPGPDPELFDEVSRRLTGAGSLRRPGR